MKSLENATGESLGHWTDIQQSWRPLNLDKSDLEIITNPALRIMLEFMKHRRSVKDYESCGGSTCPKCMGPHLKKVENAVFKNEPVTFILPAFPGKSPNPAKVLGDLPDMAEKLALKFLNDLCENIRSFYKPGAKIILCSDGRVFSDVVQITEENITAYQNELDLIIEEMNLSNLSTFNLDQLGDISNFDALREDLMNEYGQPLEELKAKVKKGGKKSKESGLADEESLELNRLYCGMTRFLVEDACLPGVSLSKTAIQKQCRARAYEVIRRSNAWSGLLAVYFPNAVRLSIHPQDCGSSKFGIQLLGTDSWMTPWHGVAVDTGKEFTLMKRWQVENLNAEIIKDSKGNPSYYKLKVNSEATIEPLKEMGV